MNQQDKDLTDFEAWYMREFEVYPRRNESGGFRSQYVNAMFKAWKGSRATIAHDHQQQRSIQDVHDLATEIWAAAQTPPGEAVIDAENRIIQILCRQQYKTLEDLLRPATLRLHLGEMTSQELRTAQAAIRLAWAKLKESSND